LLEKGLKIAICGKGGVGKSTVCAVWSLLFALDGIEVLALDADSNPNLGMAFGVPPENNPQPLVEMKELIQQRTGAKPGSVGQYFRLNPEVSDLPEKYSYKIDGVKLLVLGSLKQAGGGCACPEGAFLKALLNYTILQRQEMIIVDMEAGVEFMGRASAEGVDGLVVVVEPGHRSIETAVRIAHMAREMGITQVAAIANKLTDESQFEVIRRQLPDIELLGAVNYDPLVQQADLDRMPVIKAGGQMKEELDLARKRLIGQWSVEKV